MIYWLTIVTDHGPPVAELACLTGLRLVETGPVGDGLVRLAAFGPAGLEGWLRQTVADGGWAAVVTATGRRPLSYPRPGAIIAVLVLLLSWIALCLAVSAGHG